MTTCPSCGIAGDNLGCPNHTFWGINPLPDSIPMPEQSAWASLYAEIGRLNVLLNERDKEIEWLREERSAAVAWLRRNPGVSRASECVTAMTPFEAADAIERGVHRREENE